MAHTSWEKQWISLPGEVSLSRLSVLGDKTSLLAYSWRKAEAGSVAEGNAQWGRLCRSWLSLSTDTGWLVLTAAPGASLPGEDRSEQSWLVLTHGPWWISSEDMSHHPYSFCICRWDCPCNCFTGEFNVWFPSSVHFGPTLFLVIWVNSCYSKAS